MAAFNLYPFGANEAHLEGYYHLPGLENEAEILGEVEMVIVNEDFHYVSAYVQMVEDLFTTDPNRYVVTLLLVRTWVEGNEWQSFTLRRAYHAIPVANGREPSLPFARLLSGFEPLLQRHAKQVYQEW